MGNLDLLKDLGKVPDAIIKLTLEYWGYWWILIMIIVFLGFYFIFFGGSVGVQLG